MSASTKLLKGLLLLLLLAAAGCSDDKDSVDREDKSPHTGNEVFEEEKAPESNQQPFLDFKTDSQFKAGQTYYVYTSRLNVRSAPVVDSGNIIGQLGLNDEVMVVGEIADTVFAEIIIKKTSAKIATAEHYYVGKEYLSATKNAVPEVSQRSKYFIVQNLATEKMRIYERQCDTGNCAHEMVMETNIAVGEQTKDENTMTAVGHFNITKWIKFYQDGGKSYPSWFDPNYPPIPGPGAGVMDWTSKKVLPFKGATVRGAFGWFAAHVGPNSYSQWTHGTLGWGADKDKYIKVTRKFWANLFANPRSHGCSRTDNESIAYVRQLVPVGAPLIKIYAREAYGDASMAAYPQESTSWQYILTKNGVRVDGEKADRAEVLARGTPQSEWLEEGNYTVDLKPSAKEFRGGKSGAKSGKNGNVYGLEDSEVKGYLLIDEGRVVNYNHPSGLKVGGYSDRKLPQYMQADSNTSFVTP